MDPKSSSVVSGVQVRIECRTQEPKSVEWQLKRHTSDNPTLIICIGDRVNEDVSDKYNCTNEGLRHALIISGVSFNDSGRYTCLEDEGYGPGHDASQLRVIGESLHQFRHET